MISALMAALILGQTPAPEPVCAPPPDAALLWADPQTRVGFVGETHGTAETPAAFAEMVCEASATRPVVVALELPEPMQPELDVWMASDGGEAARATLLAHDFWGVDHADGRSSAAMFALLERVRDLKAAGRDLTLRAYQPNSSRPRGFDQSWTEIEMANQLVQAAYVQPDALVLALGGSNHARKTAPPRYGFLFAAGHLNPKVVVSLRVAYQGGRTWACFGDNPCGDSDLGDGGELTPDRRGVIPGAQEGGAYDGLVALGQTTASPPAGAKAP